MTELAKHRILVTGADGFIGSHLTERLVRSGCNVRAFVLYNSFNSWGWLDACAEDVKGQFEVFSGDIRDPHGVRTAMTGCDIVFHLAALIAIPYSYHSPHTYVDTNVKGTLNVVQAAKELSVEKVVHTSTSEVYGTAQFVPISEDHPLHAQSPYAASKIGADQIAMSFYTSFDIPVAIVRPFNTFGPRQSARAVIPTVITQIASGKQSISLGDLSPRRDFSYIEDTIEGFTAVGACAKVAGEVINLGSGFDISISETVHMIADLMGKKIEINQEHARFRPPKSEVQRLLSDITKAKEMLGWKPRFGGVSGFRKGLERTIDWFSRAENLMSYKENIYNV